MCCVKIVLALLPLGLCCLLPDMNSQDRPFSSVLPVAPPLTHRVSNWSFFSWKKTHTDSESWHLFDVEPQLIFIAVFNFYTDHKKRKKKKWRQWAQRPIMPSRWLWWHFSGFLSVTSVQVCKFPFDSLWSHAPESILSTVNMPSFISSCILYMPITNSR